MSNPVCRINPTAKFVGVVGPYNAFVAMGNKPGYPWKVYMQDNRGPEPFEWQTTFGTDPFDEACALYAQMNPGVFP